MSTYVLMRILESTPRRYDLGMRLLTLGAVDCAYDRLVEQVQPGQRVLDIGCGTGALAVRAARRGADVRAIDKDPGMLEVAARRVNDAHLGERVELCERGVAELDADPDCSFDVVTSGLCLSELSDDEVTFTLRHVERLLVPGGLFLVADETRPNGWVTRVLVTLVRLPLVLLTYVLTQQTTHVLTNLTGLLREMGFSCLSEHRTGLGTFVAIVARKP